MAHGQDEAAPEPDEIHVSPDGALTLNVFCGDEAWIGFQGFPWHVHGDLLDDDPPAVIARIAKGVREDRIMLELRWRGGVLEDVIGLVDGFGDPIEDVADHLARAEKYKLPDERIELRTWSGKRG
jgi:hypothetical protein